MSERPDTDLERRFSARLRREMDTFVRPFDAGRIARGAMEPAPRRLHRALFVSGTVVVAAVLTVIGITVLPPAGGGSPHLAVQVAKTVDLGTGTSLSMTAGDGALWVLRSGGSADISAGAILRIDPQTGGVSSFALSPTVSTPRSLTYAFGSLWLYDGTEGVMRLDPGSGAVTAAIALGGQPSDGEISAGPNAIWVSRMAADEVVRIDPQTNTVSARIPIPGGPLGILADRSGVWVTTVGSDTVGGTVVRINPAKNAVIDRVEVGQRPWGLARTAQGLWVAVGHPHEVVHLSDDLRVLDHLTMTDVPVAVVSAEGRVWAGEQDGTVEVIDPASATLVASGTAGSDVHAFAVAGDGLWALSSGMGAAYRLEVVAASPSASAMPTLPTYGGDQCLDAKLGDVRVHVDPAVSPPVWATNPADGSQLYLEWPSGFSLGLDHGSWAVFDRQGQVVVHDGGTLAGAGGGLSPRGQPWWRVSVCSPGHEASIAPTSTSQPTPTAGLPSAPPAVKTSTWTPVTLPARPANAQPVGGPGGGIAPLPGGGFIDFVVTGPTITYVYTSPDGRSWTQRGTVTGDDALGISGPVASNGKVYVALGDEGGGTNYAAQRNGAAWVSADLVHWTKAPVQEAFGGAGFRGIAGGPSGFVAIGFDQAGQAVWFSPDGLHWSVESDPRTFPANGTEPTGIVHTAAGFVMVGRIGDGAATWTSTDGRSWTLRSPMPGGAGISLIGLADGHAGLVTLGVGGQQVEVSPSDVRFAVTPWISTDGVTWHVQPSSAALFGATAAIVAAPGGYVAAGTVGTDPDPHLWTSANGADWVPVAGVDLAGATMDLLISDGSHMLLVGQDANGGSLALVSAGVER